ncbi:SDR family NAD(P)-dependent oxidoreductase [Nocardia alni]|uniref:SDR family NAD(P)-dependent oxidoreductase n=1 Tax=Nocardia alni TaxID=2815723 RepID=UPI001C234B12|nr:SDR family NAD(P)-dependent oxidoreductase [Nocardia alni]
MDESNRVAVVTGGASGLGRSICEHLARDHRVGVLDVNGAVAEQVADELRAGGAQATAAAVDVSDQDAVADAFAKVRAELGPIEVLVTSAGIGGFTPFEQITLAEWNRYLAVNLTGSFLCLQAALPDMVEKRWGRIVTISSAAGQVGALRQGHYSASKGGVIAMTKTVAMEYARLGITANSLPPFTADTPMLRAAQEAKAVPGVEMMSRIIPVGRVGTGDEIAAVCAFLCSEAASYITGQVVAVNGGAVV